MLHEEPNHDLSAALLQLSDHKWQHKEFDKRVEKAQKTGAGYIHINYDLLFDLCEQTNPKHWFRIIEWKGWRIFLVNVNGLSLLREKRATCEALKPEVDEAELTNFITTFIS